MPDISDAELATLRRYQALVTKLDSDPKSKPLLEDAIKVHHPEVRTSREELELQAQPLIAPITEQMTKLTEEVTALREARAADATKAVEGTLDSQFAHLRTAHGYTDDGIEKIKTLMVDRNIADPEAAAALFDRQNPAPKVDAPSWTPQTWDKGAGTAPGADLEALFKDEDKWADNQVGQVLLDMRAEKAA